MAAHGSADGEAIVAYEEDDDYVNVFVIVPHKSPHGAVGAAGTSSSSSSPYVHAAEEEPVPSPLSPRGAASSAPHEALHHQVHMTEKIGAPGKAAAAAVDDAAPVALAAQAVVEVPAPVVAAQHVAAPPTSAAAAAAGSKSNKHGARRGRAAAVEADDEEEDEDDYMYQAHYDRADRGRSRHVKPSSGRRGRTKKASTMGRPRGGHLSHVAGNL